MTETNKRLYYTHQVYREHGHDHTKLTVYLTEAESIVSLREKCIDNKIGYGSTPTRTGEQYAARMVTAYDAMLAAGYTQIVKRSWTCAHVSMEWLHVDGGHGEPKIDAGERYARIKENLALLDRMVKAAEKRFERTERDYHVMHSPLAFMSALNGALRAEPVYVVRGKELGLPCDEDTAGKFEWFFELATKTPAQAARKRKAA